MRQAAPALAWLPRLLPRYLLSTFKINFWAFFRYPFRAFLSAVLLFTFCTNFFPAHHHSAAALAWLPRQATSSFRNLGTFSRLKLDAIPNPNVVAFLHQCIANPNVVAAQMKVHPSICRPPRMHSTVHITIAVVHVQVIEKYEFRRVWEMHLLIRRNPFTWVLTPWLPPHAFAITGKPQLELTNPNIQVKWQFFAFLVHSALWQIRTTPTLDHFGTWCPRRNSRGRCSIPSEERACKLGLGTVERFVASFSGLEKLVRW